MSIKDKLYKDYFNAQMEIKDKEIERLNNIINELGKYLWEERHNHQGEYVFTSKNKVEDIYTMILNKLDELKGDSSNE